MINREMQALELLVAYLKAGAPYDTGNLALNSIRIIQDKDNKFAIIIGGEIADYAVYTNEAWAIGKNPNEGWIENTIDIALPNIKKAMSGTLTQKEYNELMAEQAKTLKATQELRLEQIGANI